ncbi:MAG TPA: hypothetical protein VER58_04105 [Thermoanaerobaculia bacterium]|nr:hypothetical protein [Thermoanaerobaculia bacterium]
MASDDYFLEIEAHFAFRRQTPFILSAKDWALMQRWRGEGIPLPIVIEAIDTVFDKNETSGRRKVISSLSYCRHAVKELWDARRDLYVGGSDTTPESSPEARLAELAERLQEPFASRVRELAHQRSVPRIEEGLMEIERELIDTLLKSEDVHYLRREIADSLGDSKLDPKIRARTEEANLRRRIREKFNLPRLTLFG